MAKRTGYYVEKDGRHVYKTHEVYTGVEWDCKGTSYESDAAAKRSWQKNREKRIARINGEVEKKEGRIPLKRAMKDWYDLYMKEKTTRGRPRSQQTIETDEVQMRQIFAILGDKSVREIDADTLQSYFNRLAKDGVGGESDKKALDAT